MKPVLARNTDHNPLEELGRATLQIVHDLKNQLNGLKLYATFLRKRLEREERSPEERETLMKLIAGLDRAARDMTALVRYSKPVELHRQPKMDLRDLIARVFKDLSARPGSEASLAFDINNDPLYGNFDPALLSEALQALTEEAINNLGTRDSGHISVLVRREHEESSSGAVIEWRGFKVAGHNQSFRPGTSLGSVYTAQAVRIIEAHHGRVEREADMIRALLPLSE